MNQNWLLGIMAAVVLSAGAMLIRHETKLGLWDRVIPEPVEKSIAELRQKTNKQAEACNSARNNVTNNATEIGHLKESVAGLRAELDKLRDRK